MKNQSIASIQDIRDLLNRGAISQVPEQITINTGGITQEDFDLLLELIRHRSFAHRAYRDSNEEDAFRKLSGPRDRIKRLVDLGEYEPALSLLQNARVSDGEMIIQKARALVFVGRHSEARLLLVNGLQTGIFLPITRSVAFQLLAHACLELGHLEDATVFLEKAGKLAATLGNQSVQLSVALFSAKLEALKGNGESAEKNLRRAETMVRQMPSFRWFLGFYRTSSFVHSQQGRVRGLEHGLVAVRLAFLIGDRLHAARGVLELAFMQRAFGCAFIDFDGEWRKTVESQIAENNDLDVWLKAYDGGIAPEAPLSLTRLVRLHPTIENPPKQWPHFQEGAWIFDSTRGWLLDLKNEKNWDLSPESPQAKILSFLNDKPDGCIDQEVFEAVWGIKWNEARHANTLKVAVSRLRKMGSSVAVIQKNRKLFLPAHGQVII